MAASAKNPSRHKAINFNIIFLYPFLKENIHLWVFKMFKKVIKRYKGFMTKTLLAKRLIASVIDVAIVFALIQLSFWTFVYGTYVSFANFPQARMLFVSLGAILSVLLAFVYLVWSTSRRGVHNGQTFGKQLLRIKTIDRNHPGQPIDVSQITRREIMAKSAVFFLAMFSLGMSVLFDIFLATTSKEKILLHDKLYHTDVVQM